MRSDRIIPKVEYFKGKYPLLFREGCLRSGFNLPPGWEPLVEKLFSIIEHHLKTFVPEEIREGIYVVQIKEKFGFLRVYLNQNTPHINGAIEMAESMSSITCEKCGMLGTLRSSGWFKVLCDKHHEERQELEKEKAELVEKKLESAIIIK
jgi:hypothetical protein